jgi:hypothetical protein
MSSHHFVKEGQEPALVITEAVSFEQIGPLLEWAPLVVVMEMALDAVLTLGIKIDVVLAASTQAASVKQKVSDHGPVIVLEYAKDEEPLAECFHFLEANRQTAVNLMSSDHARVIPIISRYLSAMNVSVITADTKWSGITHGHFRKWTPAGTRFLALSDGDTVYFEESGARRATTAGEVIDTRMDGIISFESTADFWVGEIL